MKIDKPLLMQQINELSRLLEKNELPEENILWGALYLLESIYEEKDN